METILVTGGLGFIGSNFCRFVLDHRSDYKIINIDCLTYAGNISNHADIKKKWPERYVFEYGDITDPDAVNRCFASHNISYVVHFAAESHVDNSIKDPLPFIKTNIYGTQILINAAKRFGVRKFVQVSTDEVYGELGSTGRFSEGSPIKPRNPYSATKAAADSLAISAFRTFGFPVVISRCSNNFGPFQHPEKLIPKMITNALLLKPLTVYGSGTDIRDWIYVIDHCRAVLSIMERGVPGEVYNVGATNEKQNIEIIRAIAERMSVADEDIVHVDERPGHDRRYAMDATKVRMEFGWRPVHRFYVALNNTIEWYKHNVDWWRQLV